MDAIPIPTDTANLKPGLQKGWLWLKIQYQKVSHLP